MGPWSWGPRKTKAGKFNCGFTLSVDSGRPLAFLSHSGWEWLGCLVLAVRVVSELVFITTGVYQVPPGESGTLGRRHEPDLFSLCPRGALISVERQTSYV